MRIIRLVSIVLLGLLLSISALSCAATDEESIKQSTKQVDTVSEASWAQYYSNFKEMASDSFVNAVVVGEITRVISVQTEPPPKAASGLLHLAFTDFEFKIERTIKGKEASLIIIHQTGAEGDFEIQDDPLFKVSEKYILFLHEYEVRNRWASGQVQDNRK
jgi:hypothetical protein